MGRKSSIEKLQPEVRGRIERHLRENRLTLDEIIADLHEHFPAEEKPSRSAVGRYRTAQDEIMRTQREIASASQALVAELGENFDDRSGAFLAQAVTTLATRATRDALGNEKTEIGDVLDLARAAKYSQETVSLTFKQRQVVAREARDKLLQEQQGRLEELRGTDGMSEQLEARIRNVLLGKA